MICFTPESARQLVEPLRGRIQHFLRCGTIWVHGHSTRVPTTEDQSRHAFGEYGTQKAGIEAYLLDEARRSWFIATILHPGHIVGPGWTPVNPAGNFEPGVFERLYRGDELALPNFGMEKSITVVSPSARPGLWMCGVSIPGSRMLRYTRPENVRLKGWASS